MNNTPKIDVKMHVKWAMFNFSFRKILANTVTITVLKWSRATASDGLIILTAKWSEISDIVPQTARSIKSCLEFLGPKNLILEFMRIMIDKKMSDGTDHNLFFRILLFKFWMLKNLVEILFFKK